MSRLQKILMATGVVALVAVIGIGTRLMLLGDTPPATPEGSTGRALIGGHFELVDHTGRAVTEASYAGKLLLVYFGYTFCPDVCPTELQVMAETMDVLGDTGAAVQPLFFTVDPERDTVQVLADYVSHFHPRLVGLTGTPEQVAQAGKAYRVYYAKAPGGSAEDYLMDHSSFIYLMSRDGTYLAHFAMGSDPAKIAGTIRKHL